MTVGAVRPAARTPRAPVTAMPTSTVPTINVSGTTRLRACGEARFPPSSSTVSDTTGRAPSRTSFPSSAARRSARRIGPTSHPVAATTKTSSTDRMA